MHWMMAELEMDREAAAVVVIVIHQAVLNYIHLWNDLFFSIAIAASLAVDRAGLLSLSCVRSAWCARVIDFLCFLNHRCGALNN
jgi:hypothetical protein